MAAITAAAPQFLVEKLNDSLTFYQQRRRVLGGLRL